jgi:hypothetical protein
MSKINIDISSYFYSKDDSTMENTDLLTDADGNIYLITSNSLTKFNNMGKQVFSARDFGGALGAAIDNNKNIYINTADQNCIRKYDTNGKQIKTGGFPIYLFGKGITYSRGISVLNNYLLVGCMNMFGQRKIYCFDFYNGTESSSTTTNGLNIYPLSSGNTTSLARGPSGMLYGLNYFAGVVIMYNYKGEYVKNTFPGGIKSISTDKDGRLMLNTFNSTTTLYNKVNDNTLYKPETIIFEGKNTIVYKVASDIYKSTGGSVYAMYKDYSGKIFIGKFYINNGKASLTVPVLNPTVPTKANFGSMNIDNNMMIIFVLILVIVGLYLYFKNSRKLNFSFGRILKRR